LIFLETELETVETAMLFHNLIIIIQLLHQLIMNILLYLLTCFCSITNYQHLIVYKVMWSKMAAMTFLTFNTNVYTKRNQPLYFDSNLRNNIWTGKAEMCSKFSK